MDEAVEVSAEAWSELLHAEVGWLLATAGVPALHIKGPTVALWLYDRGEREWGDVDILVPPSRMQDALDALMAAGFTERFAGVNRRTSTDHAITLMQVDERDPSRLSGEIDVHDRFVGIDLDAERAFDELWRRREPDQLAHVDVWFPDVPTRALLVALNVARTDSPKSREDLTRLIASAEDRDWENLIALAERVSALPALRAGLEVIAAGEQVVARTALRHVAVSPEWSLRRAGAHRTALRLEELSRLPWRDRVFAIARWILPAPAIIRMRDPAASGGLRPLVGGYARRYRDGARSFVPSIRAVVAARRRPKSIGGGTDRPT
jgi:hypothetical protein